MMLHTIQMSTNLVSFTSETMNCMNVFEIHIKHNGFFSCSSIALAIINVISTSDEQEICFLKIDFSNFKIIRNAKLGKLF